MKSMSPSSPSGCVARRPPLFVPRRTALRSFSALAALASAGALTGCGLAPSDKKRDDALAKIEWLPSEVDTESVSLDEARSAAATASCSTVGATMISTRLDEESDRNALSCPIGIALILALLHAGADAVGEGLNPALGLDAAADARTRDSAWSAVQQALQRFDIEDVQQLRDFDPDAIPETPLLHVANNILLVKEDTVVSQRYLDDAKRWYAAEVGRAPNDDAKAALDAWASLHTGGLIKKSGIDVTPGMRLVLQNALLFAARWAAPFTAEHTAKGSPFTLSDGSASTADLMTGTGTYALAQGQGWRALRLPYTAGATTSGAPVPAPSGSGTTDSGELVMDVILPDDVVFPADMPPSTWGEATAALTSARARQEVALKLPKLDLASGVMDIRPVLQSLGVKTLMLDHISPGLDIDQAVQQVRLIVAEEGTVAAALTEVGGDGAPADDASRPVEFVVDHPYVLRIVDLASGAVVIEAAILNPTEG